MAPQIDLSWAAKATLARNTRPGQNDPGYLRAQLLFRLIRRPLPDPSPVA
jgi:hypothetical protein